MDERNNREEQDQQPEGRRALRGINFWVALILFALLGAYLIFVLSSSRNPEEISLSYFRNLIKGQGPNGEQLVDDDDKALKTNIETIRIEDGVAYGTFVIRPPAEPKYKADGTKKPVKEGAKVKKQFKVVLDDENSKQYSDMLAEINKLGIHEMRSKPSNYLGYYSLLFFLFSILILVIMFWSIRRAQSNMMGGGGFLSNFSRSTAKKYEGSEQPITFDDVAGLEGTKKDLAEIVDFLRDPTKFQKLGGRVPKGVLLVGPPGTGKTLLARAIAGEANVPYFSVNGSEFIQMFVGVGASRVRDLFATAKAQCPAIIFIDEIDAVGRQRGAGLGGGHDEREQTLNQILSEMDGFMENDSVIILAATNRPDILDPALLRPGRFDRHITVARPTQKGRLAIFKVHVRDVPLAKDVDLEAMASATAGMTGADIQNLVNEAALWAARHDKNKVEMEDFYYAHDKVLMGARREEVLSNLEKERTAYHEAGHTLAAWNLKGAHPVHKVTIIPRGQALGVTQMIPEEDRMNLSETEIRDNLVVLLAGRAAEKLVYDEFTVGAENDLERATSMARRMVTHWGMSEQLGPVSYKLADEDPFLGREISKSRDFSEHTMEVIDAEVSTILREAAQKSINLLTDHRAELDALTAKLIEEEELDRAEIREIIGPSVHDDRLVANGLVSARNLKITGSETDSVAETNGSSSGVSKSGDDEPSEYVPDIEGDGNG